MKTKKFDKKLALNKKTIAHLDSVKLNAARGGIGGHLITTDQTCCGTCISICETCVTGYPCQACVLFDS